MPNLNVKGEAGGPAPAAGSKGGGIPKIAIIIVGSIVGLVLIAFILNTTGIVKLWGKKKATPVVVDLPMEENYQQMNYDTTQNQLTDMTPTVEEPQLQPTENTTVVEPKGMSKPGSIPKVAASKTPQKTPANIVMGKGMYTVQISSFTSLDKANHQADAFVDAGFPAFVESMGGWYRVCIGRYESRSQAREQGEKMVHMLENNYAVVKVNQ